MKLMRVVTLCVAGLVLAGCNRMVSCEAVKNIVAEGAKLREISNEFKFTEGPIADKQGNVYFTDQPNDRIMIYTVKGEMKTFMQPCGRSNGLYFNRQGRLIACADEKNELWRIDVKTRDYEVLAQKFDDKRLNGPNDVWVRPDGGMYLTDPFYKRPWWSHNQMPQEVQAVYFLAGDGKLTRVATDLKQPNGVIGTPDGKTLYVADIGDNKTYSWSIQPDGTLAGRKLFCEMGSDGMTIDCRGNVYLTNREGVTVFNPAGEKIEVIAVPQTWTANVTFGGPELKTLYITACTGFYAIDMAVTGVR